METSKNTTKELFSFTEKQLNVLGIYDVHGVVGHIVNNEMHFADRHDLNNDHCYIRQPILVNELKEIFTSIDQIEAEKEFSEIN